MSVRLATRRLVLRELDPESGTDTSFMLALLNDPGWQAKLGDPGLCACAMSFREHGFGMFGVERKRGESGGAGQLVGLSGLIRREGLDAPDLGFAFLEAHTGSGLATPAWGTSGSGRTPRN